MRSIRLLMASVPLLCLLPAACGPSDEEVPPASSDANGDEGIRALTREQLQQQAEAMSPEVAESLGIVDSTIRIERPVPPESVQPILIPDSVQQP